MLDGVARCPGAAHTTCTARCCPNIAGGAGKLGRDHGQRETGATLHQMVAKPDAGGIVDQEAVPIGPEDTAVEVFGKVTAAAEQVLARAARAVAARASRRRTWAKSVITAGASPKTAASTGARARAKCMTWCAASPRLIPGHLLALAHALCAYCAPGSNQIGARAAALLGYISRRVRFSPIAATAKCCACWNSRHREARSTPRRSLTIKLPLRPFQNSRNGL